MKGTHEGQKAMNKYVSNQKSPVPPAEMKQKHGHATDAAIDWLPTGVNSRVPARHIKNL